MKKVRKYFLSPNKTELYCEVYINDVLAFSFRRHLKYNLVFASSGDIYMDVTTFDLELHAFLRFSHQYIVNPDSMAGEKIEEMFEIDCLNI